MVRSLQPAKNLEPIKENCYLSSYKQFLITFISFLVILPTNIHVWLSKNFCLNFIIHLINHFSIWFLHMTFVYDFYLAEPNSQSWVN